jgi:mannose-binding lectin 2
MREVPGYKYVGHTAPMEHFIRLTSDRQSRQGSLWAQSPTTAHGWSAQLDFRISGSGRKLFGDGLAFWFTRMPRHVEGTLHGFTDTFTGFGIVFDSYVNVVPGQIHRDIALFAGAGKALEQPLKPLDGCGADFRFWEGRDDFTVRNRSSARIQLSQGNRVSLYIDEHATGDFRKCFENVELPLAQDWVSNPPVIIGARTVDAGSQGGYFGLTASTGDLADNHDLLAFVVGEGDLFPPDTFGKGQMAAHELDAADASLAVSSGSEAADKAIAVAVSRESALLTDKLLFTHHHLEHQLTAVQDSLKVALSKLQDQEKDLQRRIEELERRLGKKVTVEIDSSLAARISALETFMHRAVDRKVQEDVMPEVAKQMQVASGAWFIPFGVLAGALLVFALLVYRKYRHLMKSHLL